MAKKRVARRRVSQKNKNTIVSKKNIPNPFKRFSFKWTPNAVFFALLVVLILLGAITKNTYYYDGNLITGLAIKDVTGRQTTGGLEPVLNMVKDVFKAVFGQDGILFIIFSNLFSANWAASLAVALIIGALFYFLITRTLMRKANVWLPLLISIGFGVISIGVNIDGLTLVDWFKTLVRGTIASVTVLVIIVGFWLFILWSGRKIHSASAKRLAARRGSFAERSAFRGERAGAQYGMFGREKKNRDIRTVEKAAKRWVKEQKSRRVIGDNDGAQNAYKSYLAAVDDAGVDQKTADAIWRQQGGSK